MGHYVPSIILPWVPQFITGSHESASIAVNAVADKSHLAPRQANIHNANHDLVCLLSTASCYTIILGTALALNISTISQQ